MLPSIALACAPQSISETLIQGSQLFFVAAAGGLLLVAPVIVLVLYLIPKYRIKGLMWTIKQAVMAVIVISFLSVSGLYTYLLINSHFSNIWRADIGNDGSGVRLVHPLCG